MVIDDPEREPVGPCARRLDEEIGDIEFSAQAVAAGTIPPGLGGSIADHPSSAHGVTVACP